MQCHSWNQTINLHANLAQRSLPGSAADGSVRALYSALLFTFPLESSLSSISSTYLKTSFKTKYPLSCGARKNDWVNFLLRNCSFQANNQLPRQSTPYYMKLEHKQKISGL